MKTPPELWNGSCYGCCHLLQLGDGGCVCIRYDPDERGGTFLEDDPKSLYVDCYIAFSENGEGPNAN